jgi:hypothetical protein
MESSNESIKLLDILKNKNEWGENRANKSTFNLLK